MTRSTGNVWLHRFACVLAIATLFLVGLGGVVTTKGVGMAVPDWPTTYGENMFLFPYSKWVGGVFYEHSHRLVASIVGFLTIILCAWLWFAESRKWLRWLGVVALFGVVFQGVLGGMRVVFDSHGLGNELGIFHAAFAQLFFLLVGSIALFTSRWWVNTAPVMASTSPLRRFVLVTTVLIFCQLLFGAGMRHQHAGLAVPDFPLAYGKLWPATDSASVLSYNQHRLEAGGENAITAAHIVVHMLHRYTGLAIALFILVAAIVAFRRSVAGSPARKLAVTWVVLVAVQVTLGAWTIWSQRKVDVTTTHVAVGALTFLLGWIFFLVGSRAGVETCHPSVEADLVSAKGAELKHA